MPEAGAGRGSKGRNTRNTRAPEVLSRPLEAPGCAGGRLLHRPSILHAATSWSLTGHQGFSTVQQTPHGQPVTHLSTQFTAAGGAQKGLCGLRPVGLMGIAEVRPVALQLLVTK